MAGEAQQGVKTKAATAEQQSRIVTMERRLDRVQAALHKLEQAWEAYTAIGDDLKSLDTYLGSDLWRADRKADAAGSLPPELKRGVLSEDAIWNLLQENRELLQEIKAVTATKPTPSDQPTPIHSKNEEYTFRDEGKK